MQFYPLLLTEEIVQNGNANGKSRLKSEISIKSPISTSLEWRLKSIVPHENSIELWKQLGCLRGRGVWSTPSLRNSSHGSCPGEDGTRFHETGLVSRSSTCATAHNKATMSAAAGTATSRPSPSALRCALEDPCGDAPKAFSGVLRFSLSLSVHRI